MSLLLPRRTLSQFVRPAVRFSSSASSSALSQTTQTQPNTATGSPASIPTNLSPTEAQAPNRATKWSPSQAVRATAMTGARFEQTAMSYQPQPLAAIELIANTPVVMVAGRKAVCDGGGGSLGHPKVYINLDQPGPRSCGYCGVRFEQEHHHHDHHVAH